MVDITKTILVVDDDKYNRALCIEIAESAGYTTEIASNGQEAVEKAKLADIILMDCDMPVKSGLVALAEIRKKDPTKPIIMMTGLITEQRESEFERLEATYIEKPLKLDYVLGLLMQHS